MGLSDSLGDVAGRISAHGASVEVEGRKNYLLFECKNITADLLHAALLRDIAKACE